MPMEKLWRNPLTSPLRGLFSGEFHKMFFHRHLGLPARRLFITCTVWFRGEGKKKRHSDRLAWLGQAERLANQYGLVDGLIG
jgi:hypothetical protein